VHARRRHIISIAGFDPSAGAGILADVKTFEQIGVYGFGVCTAITVQTEDEFKSVEWLSPKLILSQLDIILKGYDCEFIKIGLIESFNVLQEILFFLKRNYPQIKVIWDPVLKASVGYEFHHLIDKEQVLSCCRDIFLITPNSEEAQYMMGIKDVYEAAHVISQRTSVFLKSYVDEYGAHMDILFHDNNEYHMNTSLLQGAEKHGSGCVLSSAIGSFLGLGYDLKISCKLAKDYTLQFLKSTEGRLGVHNNIRNMVEHG
jgi:hydroxymethylpyrimidine/phosphomethylpyrimidine kinase